MSSPKLLPNRILVEITEEDRDRIFKTIITSTAGQDFFLIKDRQAKEHTDKFYSQTVNMGRVLQVHPDCKQVQEDDIVLFDNMVDTDPLIVFESSQFRKKVVLQESHSYHTDDYLIPPSGKQIRPQFVWKKGNLDEMSRILAIYRDGKLICPETYVIADYHDDEQDVKRYVGVIHDVERIGVVARKVKVSSSSSKLQAGEMVMIEANKILTYDFGIHKFDVFFEEDVLLKYTS